MFAQIVFYISVALHVANCMHVVNVPFQYFIIKKIKSTFAKHHDSWMKIDYKWFRNDMIKYPDDFFKIN